jgi:hypothetical protein
MDAYAISEDYDYFEVSLDSEDFSDTNTGGFTPQNWPLFEIGGARTLVNVVAMKIISAEIPFSYYVVNSSNNTFVLTEDVTGVAPDIVITPGNYTSSQMITEIDAKLSAASVSETYTTTYSSSTNKFTITMTTVANATFTLTFGVAGGTTNTDLHWFLGFTSGVNSSAGLVLVSPNTINLSGPNYLYVNSQKWGQLTNNLLPQGAENLGGGNRGPQIAKVPINVGPNEVIFYDDPAPQYWFNVGFIDALQKIDFYLTLGNFKDVIDLNGLSFCLKFGVLKKKASVDTTSQGGVQNGRAIKRTRPN